MKKRKDGVYPINDLLINYLYEMTEFTPNDMPKYRFDGTIHFKDCKIVTGKEIIYFDCLHETEFLETMSTR